MITKPFSSQKLKRKRRPILRAEQAQSVDLIFCCEFIHRPNQIGFIDCLSKDYDYTVKVSQ